MKSTIVKWLLGLVGVVVCAAALFIGWQAFSNHQLTQETESRNTQVVTAITQTKEVSLLSLGIEGIAEESTKTKIFGIDVPGSERVTFLQYSFNAKLGLDGGDVVIEQTGEKEFSISVPDFIFIGHDDVSFRLVTENNGVLSWATPEIDTLEMANSILNDETRKQYIDSNEDLLREQARSFYEGIITGIDPTLALNFKFGSGN